MSTDPSVHVTAGRADDSEKPRLIGFVGSYGRPAYPDAGGITVVDVSHDGRTLTPLSHVAEPQEAGYLAYAPALGRLYVVDERKTDGRGPVGAAAAVHAFAVDQHDGELTWLNSRTTPGPFPAFLAVDETTGVVVTANHGGFDHVERVVRTPAGGWDVEYVYDDSAVVLYDLLLDGSLGSIQDVHVLTGHGIDPNTSGQAGGHAQASAHAHSVVLDPTGRYLLVGDKGSDQILVFTLGFKLELVSQYRFPPETGPRHIAFDPATGNLFVTCEFASDLASMSFDLGSGELQLLDRVSTVHPSHTGLNEPAEVRVHPNGGFVYVNNRGEDSVAWFSTTPAGELTRVGHTSIAPSLHPGVAARSFAFDPTGSFLLLADRPANLVRSYDVDSTTGALTPLTDMPVPEPAFVAFAQLPR